MKKIGITSTNQDFMDFKLTRVSGDNLDRIREKAGLGLIIPSLRDTSLAEKYIEEIDALVLTGGADIAPFLYGENPSTCEDYDFERDLFEIALFEKAMEKNIPILAICRGLQLVNVAMGGSLYTDLEKEGFNKLIHVRDDMAEDEQKDAYHTIKIFQDSKFFKLTGQTELVVNSIHHQAIKDLAEGLSVAGQADDGIIEIVEMKSYENFIGFQFHPERMVDTEAISKVYQELVRRA